MLQVFVSFLFASIKKKMKVPIIKNTLGAAGAPILDIISAARCPGEGGA